MTAPQRVTSTRATCATSRQRPTFAASSRQRDNGFNGFAMRKKSGIIALKELVIEFKAREVFTADELKIAEMLVSTAEIMIRTKQTAAEIVREFVEIKQQFEQKALTAGD